MTMNGLTPKWFFHPHKMGEPERTPLTEEFFKNGTRLESVIREGVQNSIDARAKGAKSVHVRVYCSGKSHALKAKNYAKYRVNAEERYADKGSGLVSPPSAMEDCCYLVIEDFHTTGLTGDISHRPLRDEEDRAKCNYYNYFFKDNGSGKTGGDTLGSWGTGKATFMRASRLKTSFALTVRDVGEPRVFLAGKATLQVHTDDRQVTWNPDGWFGYEIEVDEKDPDLPRAIPKRPVEQLKEKDPVAQFAKDFNLTRGNETGTSIVIPHLVVEEEEDGVNKGVYSRENLIRAVIRNFLSAILDGTLTVEVSTGDGKDKVTLDKGSVGQFAKLLPAQADEENAVTRTHYAMVREVVLKEIPKSRVVNLNHVGKGQRPEWGGIERFKGVDLPTVKKTLKDGKPILFNVPLSVLTKEKKNGKEVKQTEEDAFRVILNKADLGRAVKPAFYRRGLLIDAVSIATVPNYAAAVLVDAGPLAKVLVASEPPSHSEWNDKADKVKAICYNAKDIIRFVTTAARELLEAIENSDKEVDWDPLSDAFGIPDETGSGTTVKNDDSGDSSGGDNGDNEGDGDDRGGGGGGGGGDPLPEPIMNITKIHEGGKRGFLISVDPDREVEQGYPCEATFKFGFVPFSETGWSKYDFMLDDEQTTTIEIAPPEAKDTVVKVTPCENKLTVKLLKKGGVKISVTGFGEDRDLDWKKSAYVYDEKEEG